MSNNSPKSIALRPSSSVKPVKEKIRLPIYSYFKFESSQKQIALFSSRVPQLTCIRSKWVGEADYVLVTHPFLISGHTTAVSLACSSHCTWQSHIRLNISSACLRCDCEDLFARASDFDPGGGFPYPAPCFCSSFFKAASCFLTTTVKLSSSPTTSFFLPVAAKRTLPALTAPGFISHVRAEAHWAAWRLGTYITCGTRIVSTFLHCVISIHSSSPHQQHPGK